MSLDSNIFEFYDVSDFRSIESNVINHLLYFLIIKIYLSDNFTNPLIVRRNFTT